MNSPEHVDEASAQPSKPFKFKKSSASSRTGSGSTDDRKRSHRRHADRHRSKRRRKSVEDDPVMHHSTATMPPGDAFRESLFDALADDEGAAFWEGVYGQPINAWSNQARDPETGELSQMNDEQYAHYVRRKMWEKSTEGIEAARIEHQRAKKAREQEEATRARAHHRSRPSEPQSRPFNNFDFDFELDASIERGERRKRRKHWQKIWTKYRDAWDRLRDITEEAGEADITISLEFENSAIWPVESGRCDDVSVDNVSHFIEKVVESNDAEDHKTYRKSLLKYERVRWHPDKIQQRYGSLGIEASTMQSVTAVFQILDELWSETKG